MKKGLLVIASLLLLLSCGGQRQLSRPSSQHSLTLLTYNVGVFSKYQDNSTDGVANLIRESGASLVALNELDSCNRRHGTYQLQDLAAALGGWSYHYASAFPFAGGAYGNGVVSAQPILKGYRVVLPKADGAEQRSVAVAETADCIFASLHLDHKSQAAALLQMRVVNEWFTEHYSGCSKPVFLCGDFNVVPESEVIATASACWTQLSGTGHTHSTSNPRHCIDYIFAFKSAAPVTVQSYEVLTQGTASLSDHFPVRVTVSW